jgi:hypothetical protein
MAVLADADRAKVWAHLMRGVLGGVPNVNKADLRAAVNAVDDWCDANATNFNNNLPVAFRTNATAAQKNVILAIVCLRRAGLLNVEGE